MESIEITFPKLNHFWLDSGLLGLTVMLKEIADSIATVSDMGLTLKGTEEEIHNTLQKAYGLLIQRHYNTSTKKQIDDTKAYNFYYDSVKDVFITFPKKKSVGIAALIYDKQALPLQKQVMWAADKTDKKKKVAGKIPVSKSAQEWKWGKAGKLPDDIKQFVNRIKEFSEKMNIKIGPPSGLLVDGPNEMRPQVEIRVKSTKNKGHCYFCGQASHYFEEAGQTIFPFITGSSGLLNFNALCGKPEKVCWKCAFVGKFVPVNGFYLSQGYNLFAFFPYSVSFEKMLDIYLPLQDAKYEDPTLFKNFKHPLGFEKYEDGYFQKPFEVAFAFLYTLYRKVLLHQKGDEERGVLNWEEMCNLTISKAPLEFIVLHAESKGQTSMGKMVWQFRDSVYFFRLMELLEKSGINIKEVMRLLIDFSQKNENRTIDRNRVCERILKKQSILALMEAHVFSANVTYIKPLVDFVINYEPMIREEGDAMTIDTQEAAVTLGKRIGMTVAENGKKGDLYALKKARRKTDFLNELNRLQFKCKLVVPPDIYEGKLTDTNFVEFKQFCMIAALNSFYAGSQSKGEGKA